MNKFEESLGRIGKLAVPFVGTDEDKEHLIIIIEALEKQIPKLAKYEVFNNVPYPTCAVCGCVLWKDYLYCPHCGQLAESEE